MYHTTKNEEILVVFTIMFVIWYLQNNSEQYNNTISLLGQSKLKTKKNHCQLLPEYLWCQSHIYVHKYCPASLSLRNMISKLTLPADVCSLYKLIDIFDGKIEFDASSGIDDRRAQQNCMEFHKHFHNINIISMWNCVQ